MPVRMPPQALAGGAQPGVALAVCEQAADFGIGGQEQVIAVLVTADGGSISGRRAVGREDQAGRHGGAGDFLEWPAGGLLH